MIMEAEKPHDLPSPGPQPFSSALVTSSGPQRPTEHRWTRSGQIEKVGLIVRGLENTIETWDFSFPQ